MGNIFYRVKMIRKGTKPPTWRRAYVPANITFSQMALVLLELLNLTITNLYEFEFFRKKDRIIEASDIVDFIPSDFYYDYFEASQTYVNERLDTEPWFTFRLLAGDEPEYRVEIEQKFELESTDPEDPADFPMLLQSKQAADDPLWRNGNELNEYMKTNFRLKPGKVQYHSLNQLYDEIILKKSGLVYAKEPKNGESLLQKSENAKLQKFSDSLMDKFHFEDRLEQIRKQLGYDAKNNTISASEEETKAIINDFLSEFQDTLEKELHKKTGLQERKPGDTSSSRNPKVQGLLKNYTKDDLIAIAEDYNLKITGKTKDKISFELARQLLTAGKMKEILLYVDEAALDTWEKVMEKGCCFLESSEQENLEVLEGMCYAAVYMDQMVEVPKEAAAVYSVLQKNNYREYHRKIHWLEKCQLAVHLLLAVAPTDIVYQMYLRNGDFKDSYNEFLSLFKELPDDLAYCVQKGDLTVTKSALEKDIYRNIEATQRPVPYYIPTKSEIETLAARYYPADEKTYQDLMAFFLSLNVDHDKAELLCTQAFITFSTGGMVSDYMDYVNEADIVFKTRKQGEQFARLLMDVANNTRQYILRGHKPLEMASLMGNRGKSSQPPVIIPMSSLAAQSLDESREKLKQMGFEVDTESSAATIPQLHFPNGLNADPVSAEKKIYSNDPCPCGSGKKYKKCCGKNR